MRFIITCFTLLIAASPALASMGGSSSSMPTPPPNPVEATDQSTTPTLRQQAERDYGDAYQLVAKAKQDQADGKAKNAEKKFKKALERGARAAEIDSTYYEAWNLVGFCSRMLKDYDRSIAAYDKCLAIKPDYAPAREYLGEAYVELGKPDQAREQLAWLEKAQANDELGRLRAALDVWDKAHPSAAPVATPGDAPTAETAAAPAAAPADSSAGGTGSR
jgi:tetratricopeptide (TPR) repeat protein